VIESNHQGEMNNQVITIEEEINIAPSDNNELNIDENTESNESTSRYSNKYFIYLFCKCVNSSRKKLFQKL
jgi:hypothetical protein